MVYQCEKTVTDLGDKMSDSEKSDINAKIDALKEALKGSDLEAIKQKQDELQKAFYAVSEKIYQQSAPQDGAAPGPDMGGANFGGQAGGSGAGPDVVDADYEVVDDDKK